MKKILFIIALFCSFVLKAQLADPIGIHVSQYGANWKYDWDTVVFNRIHFGDGKGGFDSLARLIRYNNVTPAAGALIKGNGTYYDNFPRGSAMQVLRVNAAGTDLEYATLAAGASACGDEGMAQYSDGAGGFLCDPGEYFYDIVNQELNTNSFAVGVSGLGALEINNQGQISRYEDAVTINDGDVLKGTSGVYSTFPRGAALQVLRVNAGGTDLEWAAAGTDTDDQGLTITGAGPTYTIDIDGGSDVIIAAAGINALSESPANTLVITATEVDGSITNEGDLTVTAGSSDDAHIHSNTSGSSDVIIQRNGGISITESGNTILIAATGSDVNCADCVTLTTETVGDYVATVGDGTGIDGTASGEGTTYTPTLDLTEVSSATWGAGAFTTMTYDAGATDPVWTYGSNSADLTTGVLKYGGNTVLTTATGQPLDADLTTWAGITPTTVGTNLVTLTNPSAITFIRINADNTVTARSSADFKTDLGLVIGTNVQAWDADLDTWAGITPGANVGAFLATPSSANLRAALTDENGTGVALFNAATSPDFTTSLTIGGVAVPTISSTNTLTNKRITARVTTIASSATPTPDGDASDMFTVTALAAAAAFAAPTGTPTDGQKLLIRILDNGTARALSWDAIYRAGTDVVLPTTTIISKTMYVLFVYNSASTKWDLMSTTNGY